ncbi:MAG: cupin domain-containing protein, partial [Pseudomonadota bacterium]
MAFRTLKLADAAVEQAPDGSIVRLLPDGERGGLGHFTLPAGRVSRAVVHRSVEELWFFLEGEGEFWRCSAEAEAVVRVAPGTAITIPPGCAFQFRASA